MATRRAEGLIGFSLPSTPLGKLSKVEAQDGMNRTFFRRL